MPSKPHLILAPQAKQSEGRETAGPLVQTALRAYKPTLLVRERHTHCSLVGITISFPSIINPILLTIQSTLPSISRRRITDRLCHGLPRNHWLQNSLDTPCPHCISRIVVPTHCIIATVSPITHEAPLGRIVAPAPALTTPANVSTFQGPSSAVSNSTTILLQKPSGWGLTK